MRMLTDNPITCVKDDAFGFDHIAQILSDTVLQTGPLPFCVGIFGAWGSGKTSLMKMLQELLSKQSGVRSIWFDPWKYDEKEDLWNAFIQTILSAITDDIGDDQEFAKKVFNLSVATTWLAMKKAITAVSAGVINEGTLDKLAESFSKKDELYFRHINHFEKDFAEVVKQYTGGGKLIIFIDDLDRCLPENAITVLESIKLFLANASCIFVLGIHHQVVEQGIKHRYLDKLNLSGRDYLEKIIQIPFFLPPIPQETLRQSILAGKDGTIMSEEIWNIILLSMNGNPRKTKRFVNSFNLLQRFLHPPKGQSTKQQSTSSLLPMAMEISQTILSQEVQNIYLAKLLVFQMVFPDFYLHLQYHSDAWWYLENYVCQAKSLESRQQALKDRPELTKFWEEETFQNFTMKTTSDSALNYPPAPKDVIVSLLLQATSLVTESSEETPPGRLENRRR